jgi:hypothetical protein
MSRFQYVAYGLSIDSDFAFPELAPGLRREPEVTIRAGSVSETLDEPYAVGVLYQAAPGRFLLNVPRIARYLVADGSAIVIERAAGAEDADVRVFLLGSVFGALLHQRGVLPLHGSAIAAPAGAVLFLGASVSGKSTLGAEFQRRGYRILADDICAVTAGPDGGSCLWPGYPRLHLWADAAEKLGLELDGLARVRPKLEKYSVPIEHFSPESLPVSAIYGLRPVNSGGFRLTSLDGEEAAKEIAWNVFQPKFAKGPPALDVKARVSRVYRPRAPFLLEELADCLEKDFA